MKKTLILIPILTLALGGLAWLYGQGTQTISTPTATPGVIVINTPTQVKFTLDLSGNPTAIPSSVNLLRASATGVQTIVATMKDDGTSGDAVAGDKIFTAVLNLNENQSGTFGFQVSVAFPGQLRRVLSPVLQFAALAPTSIPVVLPPDPGIAGQTTLPGVDSDADGIRDDVQRYIIFTYPQSEIARQSLNQAARALQAEIVTGSGSQQVHNAYDCVDAVFMTGPADAPGGRAAYNSKRALETVVLNTPSRTTADLSADSGPAIVRSTPYSDKRSRCTFNPAALLN